MVQIRYAVNYMCGIAGIIGSGVNSRESEIKLMIDQLAHRGPDAAAIEKRENVIFAHRRLSIIDLETGDQPMIADDGMVVIAFNGEIYNFKKLRYELKKLGNEFKTSSDTEVILKGYQSWGIDVLLKKLEGMFAFSIFDENTQTTYLARDKFGEKPLFYSDMGRGIYFSSELKSLIPFLKSDMIDLKGLNLFLTLSYIPAPYTIYQGVNKLESGSYLEVNEDLRVKRVQYYDLLDSIKCSKSYTSYEKAVSDLREYLFSVVEDRMISDVPIGSFLSGGIDSSIVSAVMSETSDNPINTFSVGFREKEYDESRRAKTVADHIGFNHRIDFIDHNDLLSVVDKVIAQFDEPFGDSSALPSFFVAQRAREKVKVVLTGDAADELFGGYTKYLACYYSDRLKKYPKPIVRLSEKLVNLIPHTRYTNDKLRKVKKVIRNAELSGADLHYELMALGFSDKRREALLKKEFYRDIKPIVTNTYDSFKKANDLSASFFTDVKIVLEGDMLCKVDRTSMMNSLETRVPFLDSALVNKAFSMPADYKILKTNKKRILKDAFSDLLPDQVFKYSKKGFGVPINFWFKNELKDELTELLNPKIIEKQGIFNTDYVLKLLNEHLSSEENHTPMLWNLFVFQKWYERRAEKA